jgi:hypothetical protein
MAIQPGPGYTFSASSLGETLNIQLPWSEWNGGDSLCPLESYNIREASGAIKFNVYPGMVNNQIVRSNDMVLLTQSPPPDIPAFTGGVTTTMQTNYVYIRCGNTPEAGATPASYPSTSGEGRSSVRVFDTEQVDSDTYSYILIAVLTAKKTLIPDSDPAAYTYQLTLQRMIGCNSLWTIRFKCGSSDAEYWWSAV